MALFSDELNTSDYTVSRRDTRSYNETSYEQNSGGVKSSGQTKWKECRHFLNGKCTFGDDCGFLHSSPNRNESNGNRNEVYGRQKEFQGNQRQSHGNQGFTGNRKECRHFLNGRCDLGDSCGFLHAVHSPGRSQTTYQQSRYSTDSNRGDYVKKTPLLDSSPGPSRIKVERVYDNRAAPQEISLQHTSSGERPKLRKCKYFAAGKCTYGDECGFLHAEGPITMADVTKVKDLHDSGINPTDQLRPSSSNYKIPKSVPLPVPNRRHASQTSGLLGECPQNFNPAYVNKTTAQLITEIELLAVEINENEKRVEQRKILELTKDDEDDYLINTLFKAHFTSQLQEMLRHRNNKVYPERHRPSYARRKSSSTRRSSKFLSEKNHKSSSKRLQIISSTRKTLEEEVDKYMEIAETTDLEQKVLAKMAFETKKIQAEKKHLEYERSRFFKDLKAEVNCEIDTLLGDEMESRQRDPDMSSSGRTRISYDSHSDSSSSSSSSIDDRQDYYPSPYKNLKVSYSQPVKARVSRTTSVLSPLKRNWQTLSSKGNDKSRKWDDYDTELSNFLTNSPPDPSDNMHKKRARKTKYSDY